MRPLSHPTPSNGNREIAELTGWEISYTFLFMVLSPSAQSLIEEIEAFRLKSGMSATAFGVQALNDGRLIPNLIRGRSLGTKTVDRIRAFISSNGIEA